MIRIEAELMGNARFWYTTAGLTLMTFGIGGLSNWMPKFLSSERGFSGAEAGGRDVSTRSVIGAWPSWNPASTPPRAPWTWRPSSGAVPRS
jgi:hypothetical protein